MPLNLLPIQSYGYTYGPLYFATLMSTGLYGVTCTQTYYYYVHYRDDSPRTRYFVVVLWALDTIHEALIVAGVYKSVIAGLADPFSITNGVPELVLQSLPTVLVSISTQAFFAHRIYIFTGKNIVAPVLWAIQAFCQIAIIIFYEVKMLYKAHGTVDVVAFNVRNDGLLKGIYVSYLTLSAAIDVLIAIVMTLLLFRKRASTGFARTAHILQRLTLFAVNAGIWTAVFSISAFVLTIRLSPLNFTHMVFCISFSPLYCNLLLANLNTRAYFRETMIYNPRSKGHSPASDVTKVEIRVSEISVISPPLSDVRESVAETLVDSEQSCKSASESMV